MMNVLASQGLFNFAVIIYTCIGAAFMFKTNKRLALLDARVNRLYSSMLPDWTGHRPDELKDKA
jgi:hypothetical protein